MKKLIYAKMVSADGYVDGPDKEQNWHNWNDEIEHDANNARIDVNDKFQLWQYVVGL
jgi:hypothetical protein